MKSALIVVAIIIAASFAWTAYRHASDTVHRSLAVFAQRVA